MKLNELPKDWGFAFCDFETTGIDTEADFPIEIGLIFTDHKFRVLDVFESLIKIPNRKTVHYYEDAEKIHHISRKMLLETGEDQDDIAKAVAMKSSAVRMKNGIKRLILISDNASFETAFMKKLLKADGIEFCDLFHYCAWDTSLFLELMADGDPINPMHRALPDAAALHAEVLMAVGRLSQ